MFTGLIDHVGTIQKIDTNRYWIKTQFSSLEMGESIALDGICLTVMDIKDDTFCCEISPETFKVTTAKQFKTGQTVNLERALLPTTRLGGHFVTGHVDQVGKVEAITPKDEFIEVKITDVDKKYLSPKGSVAVNGVSLTINEVNKNGFSLTLIPHTLAKTNLKTLKVGDLVNIEFDMIAKIVIQQMNKV